MVISHCSYNYRISKIRAYVIKSNIRQYSLRNCPGFSHNLDSVEKRKQNPSEQGSTEHRAQASCYKYIRSRSKYFSRLFLLNPSIWFVMFGEMIMPGRCEDYECTLLQKPISSLSPEIDQLSVPVLRTRNIYL